MLSLPLLLRPCVEPKTESRGWLRWLVSHGTTSMRNVTSDQLATAEDDDLRSVRNQLFQHATPSNPAKMVTLLNPAGSLTGALGPPASCRRHRYWSIHALSEEYTTKRPSCLNQQGSAQGSRLMAPTPSTLIVHLPQGSASFDSCRGPCPRHIPWCRRSQSQRIYTP